MRALKKNAFAGLAGTSGKRGRAGRQVEGKRLPLGLEDPALPRWLDPSHGAVHTYIHTCGTRWGHRGVACVRAYCARGRGRGGDGGNAAGSGLVVVELLEDFFHFFEFRLGLLDGFVELLEAFFFGDVLVAFCVFLEAVVLDLLARVFDLAEAERGGGALEEVAEFGECLEVFFLAGEEVCQRGVCRVEGT